MHAWSWSFINLHRIISTAPWSDAVLWHVSICMVVYHQMAVSPGNNNNATTIGSNSPHPPPHPRPTLPGTLRAVLSAMEAF